MIRAGIGALILLVTTVAACVEPSPDATTRTVTLDGRAWQVLAATADGMRARTTFAGADGMLFDRGTEVDPQSVFFVMDGVAFPLDIAWFDGSGRLVGTASMPLCPAQRCPRHAAPAPFRWAIEAPPGAFAGLDGDARLVVEDD